MRKSTKSSKTQIQWRPAPDIEKRIRQLLKICRITWVESSKIYSFRSLNAKTRAYARIWGLNRVWQMALKVPPGYIIEVVSEKFDRLADVEKDKILLHELTHIPKNFSGALKPHIRSRKCSFYDQVHRLIGVYLSQRQK